MAASTIEKEAEEKNDGMDSGVSKRNRQKRCFPDKEQDPSPSGATKVWESAFS